MALSEIVARFEGRRVAVLGDLAVDCFVDTHPSRLSREAPVMILRYQKRRYLPGCAANTVMNLRALGAEVVPIGIVGDDEPGEALRAMFREAGITDDGLVVSGRSVVKIRVMSGDYTRPLQQVLRVDVEPDAPHVEDTMLELVARAGAADGAAGIVVSDYGYASAVPGLLRAVRGDDGGAKVFVDSRANLGGYPDADLLTPNEWEASAFLGRTVHDDEEAAAVARAVREATGAGAVLLTRGNRGMVLDDGATHMIAISGSPDIVDPSGAGDTVVATSALARVVGASYLEAATLANRAAGISVMRSGAATVSAGELVEALRDG